MTVHSTSRQLRFVDVAVTPTAKEFAGIYRGKKQHDSDFDAVLDRADAAGVSKVLLTGMSLHDVDLILNLCRSRPDQCHMTIGVHPYRATEPEDEGPTYLQSMFSRIIELLKEEHSPLSAVGELGLDYDRLQHASKEVQIKTFKAQLDLVIAEKIDLPLFLHCRSAFEDFVDVITPYISRIPRKGLVHSFVGTADEMKSLVDLGLEIIINGFSFQDPASIEMVKAIPLDRLHLETDAPWGFISPNSELARRFPPPVEFPPSKKRDKFQLGYMVKERNESCMLSQIAAIVAGLKGVSIEEVVDAAWRNSSRLFQLDAR